MKKHSFVYDLFTDNVTARTSVQKSEPGVIIYFSRLGYTPGSDIFQFSPALLSNSAARFAIGLSL